MYLSENISEKWKPVMEHGDLPEIKDSYKRDVTLRLLENQEKFLNEAAPTQSLGAGSDSAGNGPIQTWDPILISLVRRAMPQMIAYDVAGVQPMTGPTGLIFAMKSRYTNPTGAEAYGATNTGADESDTSHSGDKSGVAPLSKDHDAFAADNNPFTGTNNVGTGMSREAAERLGGGENGDGDFNEMAFSIDKISVTARSRALKAEYSTELAQDLKAVHGLDAETELANILSAEILAEINREVVRNIYVSAVKGAQVNTTTAGIFDLDTDSNGRWSVEKFKGLMFAIERDANAIGQQTRRGKGNMILCSADVASALQMAGVLDYTPALNNNLNVDDTSTTFAGVMNGRYKVYVDPYSANVAANQYYVAGYKGTSPYDAGFFYCPYVPLQMVRAVGENTFQPKIGFKTRYGMAANPFAAAGAAADGFPASGLNSDASLDANTNSYYRRVKVNNLM